MLVSSFLNFIKKIGRLGALMEALTEFIITHAGNAHYLIFGLLMLAGLNIPVSEDLMIIMSGMLAATVVPENLILLFTWTFLGCYLSDWESYWLGRLLGPRIWEWGWFSGRIRRGHVRRITLFYRKYGFLTLLVGRFIPFGVRNCLFITAGVGRMSFPRFMLADGLACFTSNFVLFTLAFSFGKNYHALYERLQTLNLYLFGLVAALGCLGMLYYLWKQHAKQVA